MKNIVAGAATAISLTLVGAGTPPSTASQPVLAQEVSWKWPNGRFIYELSPEVAADPDRAAAFEAACRALVSGSALRCVSRATVEARAEVDYVFVIDAASNHSMIGRQGGRQELAIRSWNNLFKIAHEIKHALGWGHEHQHPLRDAYIEVLFENIPPERHRDFLISDRANEGPYDFESVMHYYPTDLALPARRAIRVRPKFREFEEQMGQRTHLSATDLAEVRAIYGRAVDVGN